MSIGHRSICTCLVLSGGLAAFPLPESGLASLPDEPDDLGAESLAELPPLMTAVSLNSAWTPTATTSNSR